MKNIVTILFAAVILASCGGGNGDDKKAQLEKLRTQRTELDQQIKAIEAELALTEGPSQKVRDVKVTEVTPQLFKHYVEVQGTVDADENVNILPLASGKVSRIFVNEGDNVSAGTVLAEIEHDAVKRQLEQVQTQLKLAREVYERQERLWNQKVGSEIQFLQAKTNKESAEQQEAYLKEMIENYIIKSPINGSVDYVGLKVGVLAAPNPMDPAFRIINTNTLKVKSEIAESYANTVKKGNPVTLYFPDLNTELSGQVNFTAKVIDPLSRTFTTETLISGDKSLFRPNMVAVVKIADYENPNAYILPVNVIQSTGSEQFVYVVQMEGTKATARKRAVTVGKSYNGTVEILSGLNPNDKVVTTGEQELTDGATIQF